MYLPLIFKWLIRYEITNTIHSKQMNSFIYCIAFFFKLRVDLYSGQGHN